MSTTATKYRYTVGFAGQYAAVQIDAESPREAVRAFASWQWPMYRPESFMPVQIGTVWRVLGYDVICELDN